MQFFEANPPSINLVQASNDDNKVNPNGTIQIRIDSNLGVGSYMRSETLTIQYRNDRFLITEYELSKARKTYEPSIDTNPASLCSFNLLTGKVLIDNNLSPKKLNQSIKPIEIDIEKWLDYKKSFLKVLEDKCELY